MLKAPLPYGRIIVCPMAVVNVQWVYKLCFSCSSIFIVGEEIPS